MRHFVSIEIKKEIKQNKAWSVPRGSQAPSRHIVVIGRMEELKEQTIFFLVLMLWFERLFFSSVNVFNIFLARKQRRVSVSQMIDGKMRK